MKKLLLPLSIGMLLCGCNGGSGSSSEQATASSVAPVTKQGVIKDGALSGVNYKSNSKTGISGPQGQFEYVEGEDIEFSLGTLKLGTVKASALVTPLELTQAAVYTDLAPTNMVRLLMALDEDGNAENGIQISDATRSHFSQSADASQIDFTSLSFESDVSSTIDNQGKAIDLPTSDKARQHFQNTLKCAYAGLFVGDYNGADNGVFAAIIEPEELRAIGHVRADDGIFAPLIADAPLSLDDNRKLIHWGTLGQDGEATFVGEFTGYDRLEGEWRWPDLGQGGKWRGDRISITDNKAVIKYVGGYLNNPHQENIPEGTISGFIQLAIDAEGNVDVQSYDIVDKTLSFSTSKFDSNGELTLTLGSGDFQNNVTLSNVLPEAGVYVSEVVTDNNDLVNELGFEMLSCRL